jgi:hypothetical protein
MRTSPFENGFYCFEGINVLKTPPVVKQEKGGKGDIWQRAGAPIPFCFFEEERERKLDEAYWTPLRKELELWRRESRRG